MAILEANFMIDLIRSNSNPVFGFYGVEIFTGFEAGFESPRIRTLSLGNLLFFKFWSAHNEQNKGYFWVKNFAVIKGTQSL